MDIACTQLVATYITNFSALLVFLHSWNLTEIEHHYTYVTRFAKTDHVRTKIEIRFFGPANSCTQ